MNRYEEKIKDQEFFWKNLTFVVDRNLFKAAYPETTEKTIESPEIDEESGNFVESEEVTDPDELMELLKNLSGPLSIGDNRVAALKGAWM